MLRNQTEGSKSIHETKTSLVAACILLRSTTFPWHMTPSGSSVTTQCLVPSILLPPTLTLLNKSTICNCCVEHTPYFLDVLSCLFSKCVYDYSMYLLLCNLRSPKSLSFLYLDENPWRIQWENKIFNWIYFMPSQSKKNLKWLTGTIYTKH